MALVNDPPKKKKAIVLAESKPEEGGRDQSFITEAGNLKTFYNRTSPDTDVQIIPFYGEEELEKVRESLKGIGEEDEVFLFGHSGSTIGGVKNEVLADMLKESGTKKCRLGSCNFEKYAEPYKEIPDLLYRGQDQWLGFNPRADNLISGMFSRANDYDKGAVGIVKPIEGVHYNKSFIRPVSEAINAPERPMPELFQNRKPVATIGL